MDKFNSIEEILNCLEKTIDGADQLPTTTMVCDNFVMEPSTAKGIHDLKLLLRDLPAESSYTMDRSPGKGLIVLFEGDAHRAKKLTANLLANQSGFKVKRINLEELVSKYEGETEKNLERIINEAAGAGAILLFDEAEALFGKRSEVKDSHDRYANIDVDHVLMLIEKAPGLKIFSSNAKANLDDAFLRRLRSVISFPTK